MAAVQPMRIHQDDPTEVEEAVMVDENETDMIEADDPATEDAHASEEAGEDEQEEEEGEGEEEEDEEGDETSDDENVDNAVQADMQKLSDDFPSFAKSYRLIKRIGEGTFSTVYKAEDKKYDYWNNDWKDQIGDSKWTPPPVKRHANPQRSPRRQSRYVAIKKIYVTSSPTRIFNELDLLKDLRNCPSVCPLITAFRHTDQIIAILPYFKHADFRTYFRDMTIPDISIYFRSLFTALKSCHAHKILHRDIKPTNFLYEPSTQTGVLVDFGLAEREGSESKPCLCHEPARVRRQQQQNSHYVRQFERHGGEAQTGYPKSDTRPSKRANRAGTRGFRAPEVLFKCSEQSTSIDIWSAGVILLTILSKRFPFFNSADDVEALIEIATIFGAKRMRTAGLMHGVVFETSIPTIGQQGFPFQKIIMWSTCRGSDKPLTKEEMLAVSFLERCMDLDPTKRITAKEALEHEFLRMGLPDGKDDDMEMLTDA